MSKLPGFGVLALAIAISTVALGQAPEGRQGADAILAGDATEYIIPPLARAVLTGDPTKVSQVLDTGHGSLDEPVRTKNGTKKGERAGFTPLILAAALSDPTIARMLIEHGAKVTALDDYNRSAIWYAALREDVKVTSVLAKAPSFADVVNAADADLKRTPLHLAVRSNGSEMVQLLMENGAKGSLFQKDILGETPADYCKQEPTLACKWLP